MHLRLHRPAQLPVRAAVSPCLPSARWVLGHTGDVDRASVQRADLPPWTYHVAPLGLLHPSPCVVCHYSLSRCSVLALPLAPSCVVCHYSPCSGQKDDHLKIFYVLLLLSLLVFAAFTVLAMLNSGDADNLSSMLDYGWQKVRPGGISFASTSAAGGTVAVLCQFHEGAATPLLAPPWCFTLPATMRPRDPPATLRHHATPPPRHPDVLAALAARRCSATRRSRG